MNWQENEPGGNTTDIKELTRRALAGDVAAVRELRRRGILKKNPGEGRYPASPAQESLWLWQKQNPGSTLYSLPTFLPLPPGTSPGLVELAVNTLLARHEALRTVFEGGENALRQKVLPHADTALPVRDPGPGDDALALAIEEELERPFDLEQGPLARFTLFHHPHGPLLFANIHHLVFDGHSQQVLARELASLLEAFAADRPSPLPEPQWQYKDFAAWQARLLAGPRGATLRSRWLDRLAGLEPLELPTDFPRPACPTHAGETLCLHLGPKVDAAVAKLSRLGGVTPLTVLAWGVGAVLARYSGRSDIPLGLPCLGRTRPETQDLIGYFVNPVPLRLDLSGQVTVRESLARAGQALAETLELQDYPHERLVEDSPVPRTLGRNPLFDVLVVMQQASPGRAEDHLALPRTRQGSKFDMSFHFESAPDGIQLNLEYSTDLFLTDRIQRLTTHLTRFLVEAAHNPGAQVGDIDILPAEERRLLLETFNATARPYPEEKGIAALFEQMAKQFPQAPALVWNDSAGRRSLTYAELDRRAEAVADALASLENVRPGQVVGLCVAPGPETIVSLLGILKAGAAYMPLDPALPPARLARMAQIADCRIALGHDREAQIVREAIPALPLLDPTALPPAPPRKRVAVTGEDVAYVLFTSGSTGDPKAVAVPHRAVARLVRNADFCTFGPEDRLLQAAPLAFDASTLEIWGALLNGGALCLVETETLLAPGALGRILRDYGISVLWLTATLCHRLAEEEPACLQPLRLLMTGGETLSPPHMRRILTACPELTLVNGYGPTENTTFTSTHRISPADTEGPIPLGRPVANTRVYILDDRGRPAPIGVWGEIAAAGDGLALGYLGRPDLTEQVFVTRPELPGERLYLTGDIGRWRQDGVLEFAGRRDSQVKIRGFRVEIDEIEAALHGLPGVQEAAVVVVESGPEGRELAAVVRAESGGPEEWQAGLAAVLPPAMVPARFLSMATLPVTGSGKLDRTALVRLAAAATAAVRSEPPAGAVEETVAAVFEEILERQHIGRHDNFFELGGHSLKAMRILYRLEKTFGCTPALRDFLTEPTVAATAARLNPAAHSGWQEIPRAPEAPDYPLTSAQQRLWVLQQLAPESPAYNVFGALVLDGPLDETRLDAALKHVIQRHDPLHARFLQTSGSRAEVRQSFSEESATVLAIVDLEAMADPLTEARTRIAAEARRPFRLEAEPAVRATLFRLTPNRRVLFVNLHHIAADGWSVGVLLEDLAACYRAGPAVEEALPPLAVRFRDYAVWQADRLAGETAGADLDYWLQRLKDLPEPLELPSDRPRPKLKSFAGAGLEFEIPGPTAEALTRLVTEAGTGLFAALAGVVLVLLHRLTGRRDMVVGVPVAGRDHASLEHQVGLFVNTLALRCRLEPEQSFSDLLARIRDDWAEALTHSSCPFDALPDRLKLPRDPARNPVFDVMLVLQNAPQKELDLPGVTAARMTLPVTVSKVDLSFCFEQRGDGLFCQFEYATDLFDADRMERLRHQLLTLAASATADPQTAIDRLCLLPANEQRLVVEVFNATDKPYPLEATIPGLFHEQAALFPDAPAVSANGKTLSYAQLEQRAEVLAERLTELGLGPDSVVGLCLERSLEMMVGVFGIIRAGAAYLPLDPALPAARLAQIMEDARAPIILTQAKYRELASKLGMEVLVLDEGQDLPASPSNLPGEPAAHDSAYVIFTSGSTGRPKGVVIEHRSLTNRILWMQDVFRLGPEDAILQKTPVSFDVSVWELFWWSMAGARLVMAAPGAEKDPGALIETIAAEGVTVMHFVPSMLTAFLDWLESGRGDARRLRTLRLVFTSGEALPRETAERFLNLLPEVELHNLYGPTEAAVDVTWEPVTPGSLAALSGPIPIGRPIHNTRVHILDKALRPLPLGVYGEICLGGVQIARGYLNRPELTAERFLPDPFHPGERLYRTGDLGRFLADGRIEYAGRNDQQIKIHGQRIEPAEVEAALLRCPGINKAVVVAESGPDRAPVLTAYLQLEAGIQSEPTPEGLRGELRQSLPEAMIPDRYLAVDGMMPLTSSGKLDRKALTGRRMGGPHASGLPVSDAQDRVLEIWRQVLPGADFGVADSFFDAGGNSLLAIRLHGLLDQVWPGRLSLADLFLYPTVAAQAEALVPQPAAAPVVQSPDMRHNPAADTNIAIIGASVRVADYRGLEGFWNDLAFTADRVAELSEARRRNAMDLMAACGIDAEPVFGQAAYLNDIAGFDYQRFGLSPADATLLDPNQRLFLETATTCLDDAGHGGRALRGKRVGVFVGASGDQLYRTALSRCFPERAEQIFALNVPSNLATRIAYSLDWRGPAAVIDTACSSSLNALHLACRALRAGECELALVGGVKLNLLPHRSRERFAIESAGGRTRAFDDHADGTGEGEGAGALLLKPLARAVADDDAIHAVVIGSAVNQDGASAGMAAPNPGAQAEVILAAAEDANIRLDSISYVEAHGTGTQLGDPIEILGLTKAFAAHTERTGFAGVGSVKGNFGHLDAAAGLLGLVKAMLVLQRGLIPPQPFFNAPNRSIDFAHAPVFVPDRPCRLPASATPARAGVSSFGLSGVNCHVILEAAPPAPARDKHPGWFCLPLSAASLEGLRSLAGTLAEAVSAHPGWRLADIAHTLTTGREHLCHRLAVVAETHDSLIAALIRFATGAAVVEPAADCYLGQAAEDVSEPSSPPDSPRSEAAARALAEHFVAGAVPEWYTDPGEPALARLHLPPTPFESSCCWPRFAATAAAAKPASVPWVTTSFLDGPTGFLHRLPVDGPEFWAAAEHRLLGQPTLVGTALPRLCVEAARLHLADDAAAFWSIRELSWLRPLSINDLAPDSAQVRIAVTEGRAAVSLEGRVASGQWTVFAEAAISPLERTHYRPAALDMAELEAACPVPEAVAKPSTAGGYVTVSPRWDCLAEIRRSTDGQKCLATLDLPSAYSYDLSDSGPHPAMLDVALSLGLDGDNLIPAACTEMRLFAPLPGRFRAFVSRRDTTAGRVVVDAILCSESGTVLAEIDGMVFKRPETVALAYPSWTARPEPEVVSQKLHEQPGPVLLLADEPLGESLAAELRQRGRGVIAPADAANASQADPEILARLCVQEGAADIIWAKRPSLANAQALAWFLRALLRFGLPAPMRLLAVGRGGCAVTGKESFLAPESALAAGLCLTLPKEEPLLSCRYLDIDAETGAGEILHEMESGFPAPEEDPILALRKGQGYVRVLAETPAGKAAESAFREGGCYVITGGLGGMGLNLAKALATLPGVRLGLLSRQVEIPAESTADAGKRRDILASLERSGVRMNVYSCDVSDRVSLENALAAVRRDLGPITGVLHCAGSPGDGFLLRKEDWTFRQVLAPKVDGTRLLHELTLQDPIEVFLLAASVTGLEGAAGQSDYTAANAFLDAFAHWRRQQGLPAVSIDWPTLTDIGMAFRNRSMAEEREGIPAGAIPGLVKAALASGAPQVVPKPHRPAAKEPLAHHRTATPTAVEEHEVRLVSRENRSFTTTELAVGRVWGNALGYRELPVEKDFYTLGGDSIVAMGIVNRVKKNLGVSVSLADFFTAGTVAALAAKLAGQTRQLPPLTPAPASAHYPLTRSQTAVYKAEMAGSTGTAYNLPQFFLLGHRADPGRLQRAFEQLVARHEILRTHFIEVDGEPRMLVEPTIPFQLDTVAVTEPESRDWARSLTRPFDLGRAPLFRATLAEVENDRQVLFLDIHHILADAMTLELLTADLIALYDGESRPLEPLQLRDYAVWERNLLDRGERERVQAYWLDLHRDGLPVLNLPADFPRPPRHTFRGASLPFEVESELLEAVRTQARRFKTTPSTLVLAAWTAVLDRYTGGEPLCFGLADNGRVLPETETMAGMFTQVLPLRLTVAAEDTVADLIDGVRTATLAAFDHRLLEPSVLLESLAQSGFSSSPDRLPLSELTLSYMNFNEGDYRQGSLGLTPLGSAEKDSCKGDLAIFARETATSLTITLEYYAEIFNRQRMERLSKHFLTLLEAITRAEPDASVADLPLLDNEETRLVTHTFNATSSDAPPADSLAAAFLHRVEATPNNVALEHGTVGLTYAELARRSAAAALELLEAGVQQGDIVGLCGDRSPDTITAILGIIRAGAAYMPLDPKDPPGRLETLLKLSNCTLFVADPAGRKALSTLTEPPRILDAERLCAAGLQQSPPPVDALNALDSQEPLVQSPPTGRIERGVTTRDSNGNTPMPPLKGGIDRGGQLKLTILPPPLDGEIAPIQSTALPPPVPGGEAPAYVLFTSGSTGEPKAVVVPHRGVLRLVLCDALHAVRPEDVVLQIAPLGFDASTLEIWGGLLAGRRLCLAQSDAILAPGGLARIIESHSITYLWLTASLCNRVAEAAPETFRPLRILLTGGEALSPRHMRHILTACPELTLVNGYGPTENTTFTTTHRVTLEETAGPIPIGRPIPQTRVYILDRFNRAAPIGVWGEIAAAGDGLAVSYLGRPDLTREAFIDLPSGSGERVYLTGDLGRWREDGVIEFLGRRDGQIKIRGHRVEPEEVEAVLHRAPGVAAAALTIEGSGEHARLTACLTTAAGFDLAPVLEELRQQLPVYMIPGRFVSVPAIPLNSSGKTDRLRLAEMAADAPELSVARNFDPPRTESEQVLAAAFAQVFHKERISRDDNFYDLGGHSLMAARLAARVAETTGIALPLGEIFRRPTVAALAELLDTLPKGSKPIPSVPAAPDYPVSHAQQRLYVLHRMQGGDTAYNMPFAFEFGSGFNPSTLRRALAALMDRHEALRTAFVEIDGEPRQVIVEQAETPFYCDDLSALADPRGEAFRLARRELHTPFDLATAPLFRVRCYHIGDDASLVFLVMHHIIGDGWTMHVLFSELQALYAAERQSREPAALPPLPIQYKDFAVWQRGRNVSAHADYWRERLQGAPERVALPYDRPARSNRSFRGAAIRRLLDKELSLALHEASKAAGITLANLMLALFATLLYRLTRQEDMVVGLGIAGRNHPEIERVAGFFVNILPIRLQLSEEMELTDLLAQVQETTLAAFDRQDYPFDLLVRTVAPRRVANRQPLLNVMFEYQDFSAVAQDNPPQTKDLISRPFDEAEMRALESGTAKYDITLFVVAEPDDRLQLRLEYDTDLFDAQTANDWLNYLAGFATAVAADSGHEDVPAEVSQ